MLALPLQLPRVHAVLVSKLSESEQLPVITFKDSMQRQAQVAELRAAALDFLSASLGGDRLAAEYVLLYLLSRCAAYELQAQFVAFQRPSSRSTSRQ